MNDRKILVPLDQSAISDQTVQNLLALKDVFTFPLTLLHVHDHRRLSYQGFGTTHFHVIEQRARESAQTFIEEQQARFTTAGIPTVTLVLEGPARETICSLADSGEFDLLVIGRKPDTDLRNIIFGQVAHHAIHTVKCPVLIL